MNLYELTSEYLRILEMMDDETADINELSDALVAVDDQIEVKAENYAKIVKNLEASVFAIKTEQERLMKKRKSLESNIDRLKENLKSSMQATGTQKIKTDLFTISIQKNGGKIPVVMDELDTSKLPDELVRITEEPNIDAIRALLEKGEKCIYAHLGERGESLRIR